MKNRPLTTILILAILVVVGSGIYNTRGNASSSTYPRTRIQLIETFNSNGLNRANLIRVDGIEYLLNVEGGIIRHERPKPIKLIPTT